MQRRLPPFPRRGPRHRPQHLARWFFAVLLLGCAAAVVAPAPAHADGDTSAVMALTLDNLSPSVLPKHGHVTIHGTVTNTDTQTWSYLNLQAFASQTPITTEADLLAQSKLPPESYLGPRIQTLGTFAQIAELAPGESQAFTVRVPVKDLGIPLDQPGVYWIGVHALGTDAQGIRPPNAIGRARTFIAEMPKHPSTVPLALTFQLRRLVVRDGDGRLSGQASWSRSLGAGGSLSRVAAVATAAGSRTINWAIDPSVVDGVQALATGNDARPLGLAGSGQASSGTPSPGPSSGSASSSASGSTSGTTPTEPTDPLQATAQQWLSTVANGWRSNSLYLLPYGDLDVDGAALHDQARYAALRTRSGTSVLGLSAKPVVAPPNGLISAQALNQLPLDVPIVLSDQEVPARSLAVVNGHQVLVSASDTSQGGPGPDDPFGTVAMRQRVLAEAALRSLQPHPQPLVVVMPAHFLPDSPGRFFTGLDQPWLSLVPLSGVTGSPTDVPLEKLHTTEIDPTPEANFVASRELLGLGDELQQVLVKPDGIVSQIQDQAALSVSYSARFTPELARSDSTRATAYLRRQLSSITVTGPSSVTLSSDSGPFAVTIHNGLDAPITVQVHAHTDGQLKVAVPERPRRIAAGSRDTVLLRAGSSRLGVHNVVVSVTDTEGHQVGSGVTVPVRAAKVSGIIWVIAGVGGALLFGAIVARNVRRIRGRKS